MLADRCCGACLKYHWHSFHPGTSNATVTLSALARRYAASKTFYSFSGNEFGMVRSLFRRYHPSCTQIHGQTYSKDDVNDPYMRLHCESHSWAVCMHVFLDGSVILYDQTSQTLPSCYSNLARQASCTLTGGRSVPDTNS